MTSSAVAPSPEHTNAEPRLATPRWRRVVEMVALFIGIPLLLTLLAGRINPLPVLAVILLIVGIHLYRDPTFDRGAILRLDGFRRVFLRSILPIYLAGWLILGTLLWLYDPRLLFAFPRQAPHVWAIVMVGYPIASVIPQTALYRGFFFHRYRPLLGDGWAMILVGALMFAFGHIIFRSWVALALTLVGGLLFAWRYRQTRSLLISAIEHAMFGQMIFTLGYGVFLYHGSVRVAQQLSGQ
jgi:membrane protease YdiL (CAAX protease family)